MKYKKEEVSGSFSDGDFPLMPFLFRIYKFMAVMVIFYYVGNIDPPIFPEYQEKLLVRHRPLRFLIK